MSPFSKKSRSLLSEQFADIFHESQEDYRALLNDLRDNDLDVDVFTERAEALLGRLVRLKRIRLQLRHEREELTRLADGHENGTADSMS